MAHPGGRPTKYSSEFDEQARKLCLLGATDEELAEFFEVDVATIYRWKNEHEEFCEAIKDGKVKADAEIGERLHQRASGFEWDEEVPIKVKEVYYENGKRESEVEHVEMVTVHKVVPPDPTSAIFWLKNRRPQNWRDKSEVDLGVRKLADVLDDLEDDVGAKAKEALDQQSEA
jgi:hypothetical protein